VTLTIFGSQRKILAGFPATNQHNKPVTTHSAQIKTKKVKAKISIVIFLILNLMSCENKEEVTSPDNQKLPDNNQLSNLSTDNISDLRWLNEPKSFKLEQNSLTVVAEKGTDFFNNPEDGSIISTAPLLFKQIAGDFVAKALVRPDFSSMWNAVAIMVHIDSTHWIKFAFENSDATGQSVVSVVTKDLSDDANGVILAEQDMLWLKLIRKGNIYSMLWSQDDKTYKMARLTAMPSVDSLKIGIEAQCPVGESATHEIRYFNVEKKTVEDLRKGE
jgi:regulation of enolase protein 1 (concanavalin A-like superfamily)